MTKLGKVYGKVPKMLYGTAWKKERTEELVFEALRAGFRGVDTAAQPRHYQEDLVGKGIKRAIDERIVTREDLFIQTKYTPISGQDPNNMPYDSSLSIPDQVHTSIASSLRNLRFSDHEEPYIDCLLLHSPLPTLTATRLAWKTLETYVPHKIRHLGISNVPLPTLRSLLSEVETKPTVVQNRFYQDTSYEVALRKLCKDHNIVFESFWTLTGNPRLVKSRVVLSVARSLQKTIKREEDLIFVSLYALVLGLEGITILNGTTKPERMSHDLELLGLIERLKVEEWKEQWPIWLDEFKTLIGQS